jgi:hypothetical protein
MDSVGHGWATLTGHGTYDGLFVHLTSTDGGPACAGCFEADSLDAAAAASADHPYLDHGGQVQVFETIDMS